MILAFTGQRFLAEEQLHATLHARGLSSRDWPRFAGEDVTVEALGPHLTPGLFGGGGVIVDLEGIKPDKALLSALGEAQVPVAILDEAPPATRLKLYEQAGEVISAASPQKPAEIAAWVMQRSKQQQVKLDRDAAQYLAEVFGTDLAGIASELTKLSFLGGPHDRASVQQLVGREPPGDSFAMLGAVTSGRLAEALTQLGRLLASGEDPFKLLGAIVWQYGLVARCVGLLAQEGRISEAVAAQRLGIKPYPAKKALEIARTLNEAKIAAQLERILHADLAMKRGQEPAVVLERLLIGLGSQGEKQKS